MAKTMVWLAIGFVGLLVLVSLFTQGQPTVPAPIQATEPPAVKPVDTIQLRHLQEAALAKKWTYDSSTDQMTGRTARFARIQSENTVQFDFPYGGAQRGTLTLQTHPSYGRSVIFRIERGQLLCNEWSGSVNRCRVRIRFDDGAAANWTASPPSDYSSELMIFRDHDEFVQRMRAAKIVRVQPGVYQEGNPVFEFHVGGFDHERYRTIVSAGSVETDSIDELVRRILDLERAVEELPGR